MSKKLVRKVTNERSVKRQRTSQGKRMPLYASVYDTQRIYKFERITNGLPMTYNNTNGFYNSAGTTIYGTQLAFSFALSQVYMYGSVSNTTTTLPSNSDFSNLFDFFKIDWVEIIITHACKDTSIQANTWVAGAMNPNYYIAQDQTDAYLTEDISAIQQKAGCVMWRPSSNGEIFKKRFYPRLNSTVANPSSTTNQFLELPKGAFISTAGNAITWNGIKIATDSMSQLNSTVFMPVQFNFRYGVSCKGFK